MPESCVFCGGRLVVDRGPFDAPHCEECGLQSLGSPVEDLLARVFPYRRNQITPPPSFHDLLVSAGSLVMEEVGLRRLWAVQQARAERVAAQRVVLLGPDAGPGVLPGGSR